VEDRIYRSLRTAQERELQSHPTPAQPDPAPVPRTPAPELVEPQVAPPSHGPVRPADPLAFRWFARGFGADRPRISIVGTLSLSVLISAGLFAAQAIKHRGTEARVAVDSNGRMRLAAHQADDGEDDNAGPVSVPSHFQHVHAPTAHARKHSTHAVASDEQSAADDRVAEEKTTEDSSDESNGASAAKTHHRASASHSVQHAADESDASQLDVETSTQPFDRSVPAPPASGNHELSNHDGADQVSPMPAAQSPAPQAVAAPYDHMTVQPNVGTGSGQAPVPTLAQPAAAANAQATDSSRWPVVPSATPAAAAFGTLQVSAEASNANAPTLTIVPGRPDSISATMATQSAHAQPVTQQPPVAQLPQAEPIANRPVDLPAAHPSQPASPYGLFQDRPDVTAASATSQPVANPLEALDHSKVMSFQFRNAPWTLVLAKFANATGLELRLQAMPDGTFNRWDSARYTPTQTLTILNAELAKLGCQAKVVGTALCIVPATTGDAAIPTSAVVPVSLPGPTSSSQLPQYPGVPVNAAATSGTR
jgi:hypothetical protein